MSGPNPKKLKIKRKTDANLIPCKPGAPPKPMGRPPGTGFKQRALLACGGMLSGPEGKDFLTRYVKNFRKAADKPDTWQARFIAERVFKDDVLDELDAWIARGERCEQMFLSYQLHKRATDIQRTILFSRSKYQFFMAGRRAGKSQGLSYWFADAVGEKPWAGCLYVRLT